jgi:hypothetical protein
MKFWASSAKALLNELLKPLTIPNNKVKSKIAKATVKPDITERNLFLLIL